MEVLVGNNHGKQPVGSYACALGFFDGVHVGHQSLIKALKNVAAQNKLKSMVFTFEEHPMALLDSNNAPKLITDNTTKTAIFSNLNIDLLKYSQITRRFLNTKPEDFLKNILISQFNVKAIVAGFNFRFGFKGEGDSEYLLNFGRSVGIDVVIVDPFYLDGQLVSSTVIRNMLTDGNITKVNEYLARHYTMHGTIIHGKMRGRNMGFPTANIVIDDDMAVPKSGVYVTRVNIDGEGISRASVTNIGCNPTFGNNGVTVETHIIDYNNEIYGKEVTIEFHQFIRDEIKFKDQYELSKQITNDKIHALKYFE